jgi:hypothetical protein
MNVSMRQNVEVGIASLPDGYTVGFLHRLTFARSSWTRVLTNPTIGPIQHSRVEPRSFLTRSNEMATRFQRLDDTTQ